MTDWYDTAPEAEIRKYARELDGMNRSLQWRGTQLLDEVRALRSALRDRLIPYSKTLLSGHRFDAMRDALRSSHSADCKHGTPENHLSRNDGTGNADQVAYEVLAKDRCQRAGKDVSWALILEEECAEALACKNVDDLDLELSQVAATAIRWKEAIARRRI